MPAVPKLGCMGQGLELNFEQFYRIIFEVICTLLLDPGIGGARGKRSWEPLFYANKKVLYRPHKGARYWEVPHSRFHFPTQTTICHNSNAHITVDM